MIKAIIFDAGGVYLKGSFINFVNESYKVLGIKATYNTDKELVFDDDYNRGKIGAEDCFRKYFGVKITPEKMKKIVDIWRSTWQRPDDMEDIVARLKNNNYRLAILSNSDKINSEVYEKRGWWSPFDVLVLSHKEGILKPEKRIYEITLDRLMLPANECVFIDDQIEALVPAEKMGMKTIHYKSFEQMRRELTGLGVNLQ